MVQPPPLVLRCCSAAYFMRNSSMGLSGRGADDHDISTTSATTALARFDEVDVALAVDRGG